MGPIFVAIVRVLGPPTGALFASTVARCHAGDEPRVRLLAPQMLRQPENLRLARRVHC